MDSQLADLGVDSASIKRINHSAVLMHLDAFGGPCRGPLSDAVGYDDLLQAATGIQVHSPTLKRQGRRVTRESGGNVGERWATASNET